MDFAAEFGQLFGIGIIAAEQDDATDLWIQQALTIVVIEYQTLDVEHYRSECHFSTTPIVLLRQPLYPVRDR